MSDLKEIRREYLLSGLDIDSVDHNPIVQFSNWLNDAIRASVPEPTAMVLSTCNTACRSSSRIVLLKDLIHDGFSFFTNYESKKADQIRENPFGSLLFFWPLLERQVRVEGRIAKTTREESDEYYRSRPEGSKIGAWISPQSRRIPNREYLENLQHDYLNLFKSRTLDRPENWGGYILMPDLVEFWQGRENRLHDRFEYSRKGSLWEIQRLAP
ncbi:MAG TPA: pyridoxamine 5'-phosphate oxidase [Bacteroidales bacterium]|nr:pyridoxamine 5'-phosphate oxidase [Bacteroidales bacterium]